MELQEGSNISPKKKIFTYFYHGHGAMRQITTKWCHIPWTTQHFFCHCILCISSFCHQYLEPHVTRPVTHGLSIALCCSQSTPVPLRTCLSRVPWFSKDESSAPQVRKPKLPLNICICFYLFIYLFNVQPVLPPTKRRMLQCLLKIWFPTLPMKNGEGHITCFYRVIFNSTTTQSETVQLPIVPLWKCHSRWLVHGRLMVCLWDLHKHPVGVEFLWPIVSQQK